MITRPVGLSLLPFGSVAGEGVDTGESGCWSGFVNSGDTDPCAETPLNQDIAVFGVYIGYQEPQEAAPVISGIQVNGVVTNGIVAGTTGYIAIYDSNLDGATAVTIPNSGINITSFQVIGSGQINAFGGRGQCCDHGGHHAEHLPVHQQHGV